MISYIYQHNGRIITKALWEKKYSGSADARYGLSIIIKAGTGSEATYYTIPAYLINSSTYWRTK